MVRATNFTPAVAQRSLEKSLSELRTDYVDLFLLHECTLADAQSEELIGFLQTQIGRGTVRSIGVATDAANLPANLAILPSAYSAIQAQHNVAEPTLDSFAGTDSRWMITHGALRPLPTLAAAAASRADVSRRWSERIGVDLSRIENLAPLLIAASLAANKEGTVLFSTTRSHRIAENVRGAASGDVPLFTAFVAELFESRSTPHQ
jgi:hypothetical protein